MGVLVEIRVGGRKLKYFFSHWELSNEKKMSLKIYFLKWTFWPVLHCEYVWFQKRAFMYYLSNSILIRNIIFHVILGKKHILVVYTDTDTVSVRLPYRHSVSTAHTQISYFRNTTTLTHWWYKYIDSLSTYFEITL